MDEFHCYDCDIDTLEIGEYYMVDDHVWVTLASMDENDGMLCIGCLEARIGRTLNNDDFTDAPVNHPTFLPNQSSRLTDRLEA